MLANGTITIILDSFMFFIGAIILYFQNTYLFGIALLIAFLYVLTVLIFNKKVKRENENLMESNSKLTSYLIESLNGVETIKLFNAERKINLKIEKNFIAFIKNTFKLSLTTNFQTIIKMSIELIGSVFIYGLNKDISLCHGDMGNIVILKDAALVLGNKKLYTQSLATIGEIIKFIENLIDTEEFKENEHSMFMTGLSGIGYEILRLINKIEVPNILGLE
nr:ABC transporter transmembrane domain-containing protein [uncultured Tyzzerella sp.]